MKITNQIVLIIGIAIPVAFPETVNAQFGIKTGMTVSTIYYTGKPLPYDGYDIDLRPFLGYDVELVQIRAQSALFAPFISIYRTFRFSSRIGIRPELGFTQKGVRFHQDDYEGILYILKISYLELPLSVTYQYLRKPNSTGDIFFGGFGAYCLGAVKKVSSQEVSYTRKIVSVKSFEGGIHAGFSYKRKVCSHFLCFEARVFLGLSDIFTIPKDWTDIYYETQKTKITGFNFSIGYEM